MRWEATEGKRAHGGGSGGVVGGERVGVGADTDGADGNAARAGRARGLRSASQQAVRVCGDEDGTVRGRHGRYRPVQRSEATGCGDAAGGLLAGLAGLG